MSAFTGRNIALAAIVCSVALILPFGNLRLGHFNAFIPMLATAVFFANALTAWLLFRTYRHDGPPRALGYATAYAYGALMVGAYALAFPGFATDDGLTAASPSTAAWIWRAWHLGFPLLLASTVLLERWYAPLACGRRTFSVVAACTAVTSATVAIAFGAFRLDSALPAAVTDEGVFTPLWNSGEEAVLLANVLAILVLALHARTAPAIEKVGVVVATAFCADTVLSTFADGRFTLTWYSSRAYTVIAATAVLLMVVNELTRTYRRSEDDRRFLEEATVALMREQRALEALERRSRSVIENAADAFYAVDPSGRIQEWNVRAAEMLGYTTDEAISRNLIELLHPEIEWPEQKQRLHDFWDSADRHHGRHLEMEVVAKDGRVITVEVTAWIEETEEPRLNVFARDISARKQAEEKSSQAFEEQTKAMERLKELDKAKSDFVSSISHELRSPLTSTLGFLELLIDGDAGELLKPQRDMAVIAERNARRLQTLIEDLLTLSRIESGSFGVRFRPVDVSILMDNVVTHARRLAGERDITLTYRPDPLLGECPGDETQLNKALSSIVGNAIKFSDSGADVEVIVHRDAEQVRVIVKDDGIGIPHDEQDQLFRRFFRSSVAIERQHQGAGLGLTIARAVFEHHGGEIEVQSTLNVGTVVTITLPAFPVTSETPTGSETAVIAQS